MDDKHVMEALYEYMTIEEALNYGPVYAVEMGYDGACAELHRVNEYQIAVSYEYATDIVYHYDKGMLKYFDLMDYFEPDSSSQKGTCICDFNTVILPYGCQCGGK